ncbi:hypothetical protein GCM10022224_093820 [Nonomuraea antimicrobica]|uniref:Uncharacterized protein n=1 Tax=Nonomuraea antimicrobica TaxID=561173 RepID=A0ABP7E581_9ACTN
MLKVCASAGRLSWAAPLAPAEGGGVLAEGVAAGGTGVPGAAPGEREQAEAASKPIKGTAIREPILDILSYLYGEGVIPVDRSSCWVVAQGNHVFGGRAGSPA